MDEENYSYAQELLEDFYPYLHENKWFTLLKTRLLSHTNPKIASRLLTQLIEDYQGDDDIVFNAAILSFMTEIGNPFLFVKFLKETLPLMKTEEDFIELLSICAD
jgi:hypothetical protein